MRVKYIKKVTTSAFEHIKQLHFVVEEIDSEVFFELNKQVEEEKPKKTKKRKTTKEELPQEKKQKTTDTVSSEYVFLQKNLCAFRACLMLF